MRFRLASNPGGPGHLFIKGRFGIGSAEGPPDGRCFVPAKLADNPYIDEAQYRTALAELDPVSRAQLEEGDWDAMPSGRFDGAALRRHRYRAVPGGGKGLEEYALCADGQLLRRVRLADCSVFLTCDPAASDEPLRRGRDPDYTAICAWALSPESDLIWLDTHRFRLEIPDILPQVQSVYLQHRPLFVGIEAVASNRAVFQYAQRMHMAVRELSPRGMNKLARATPAMVKVSLGRVWLPERAHWLDQALTELLSFQGDGKTHDDVVDNLSYACSLADELGSDSPGARPITLAGRGGKR
jgi:predicted phage terminase large subunit-like protein